MSGLTDCMAKQKDLPDCVYLIRTARQEVSTGTVNSAGKCLTESRKVSMLVTVIQKASFCVAKGILLQRKRYPFSV